MQCEFLCVEKDEEVTHPGGKAHPAGKGSDTPIKTEYTVTFSAVNVGGNGQGGALGTFQLPLLDAETAKQFVKGESYLITIAPKTAPAAPGAQTAPVAQTAPGTAPAPFTPTTPAK